MYMQKNAFVDISTSNATLRRGFAPLYHADTVNHCPACGHTHWHIGRAMAECAFCETALPLAVSASQPVEPLFWSRGNGAAIAA
jgi:hypothetical protein